jgi:hypothetical protein
MAIWNILQAFGIFYEHWDHFVFIFTIWASCIKKNLATLIVLLCNTMPIQQRIISVGDKTV